ncbi:MAG: hypothetical protein IKZ13_01020 [Akkermansia sp.]|nr:hypothetical protein [Akkermansia sp.]
MDKQPELLLPQVAMPRQPEQKPEMSSPLNRMCSLYYESSGSTSMAGSTSHEDAGETEPDSLYEQDNE